MDFDWTRLDGALLGDVITKVANLLECTVCLDSMVAPVTCECGHSFCYECIHQWFHNKLLCPTCRAEINTKPKLSVLLRDIGKHLHDIAVETTMDESKQKQLQRSYNTRMEIYDRDAKNECLFGDLFDNAVTIIDNSDGVPRCGQCGWEVHGDTCDHCGVALRHPVDEYDEDERAAYEEGESIDDDDVVLNYHGDYESDDGFVVLDEEVLETHTGEAISISDQLLWNGLLEREFSDDDERPIDPGEGFREDDYDDELEHPLLEDDEDLNDALNRFRSRRVIISDSDSD